MQFIVSQSLATAAVRVFSGTIRDAIEIRDRCNADLKDTNALPYCIYAVTPVDYPPVHTTDQTTPYITNVRRV